MMKTLSAAGKTIGWLLVVLATMNVVYFFLFTKIQPGTGFIHLLPVSPLLLAFFLVCPWQTKRPEVFGFFFWLFTLLGAIFMLKAALKGLLPEEVVVLGLPVIFGAWFFSWTTRDNLFAGFSIVAVLTGLFATMAGCISGNWESIGGCAIVPMMAALFFLAVLYLERRNHLHLRLREKWQKRFSLGLLRRWRPAA